LNGAKSRSKKKGWIFDDSLLESLTQNPITVCACCGSTLDYSTKNRNLAPSIDRVDNNQGYIQGNVSIICFGCNTLKSNASPTKLGELAKYIHLGTGNRFAHTALEVAEVVAKKNKVYGDSFTQCSAFLKLLYPNGVQPNQYADLLVLTRLFDKMMRVATGAKDEEYPYFDMAGYALLMLQKAKEEESQCQ
jgi:hypothetical protein